MARAGRSLLLISPVMPAESGNGLAMRAGVFLEALATDHDVTLVVIPVSGPAEADAIPAWVARLARRVVVVPADDRGDTHHGLISRVRDPDERARAALAYPRPLLTRFASPRAIAAVAARIGDVSVDVVHVFRVYMAPFAAPFLAPRPDGARALGVLDLDDDEPTTRRRLAEVLARRGRHGEAAFEAAEADKYARHAQAWLPRFDRVIVCAERDRLGMPEPLRDRVAVVPNAVREPACTGRAERDALLLVASFGYAPNEDAARFLGEEVWPRVAAARSPLARLSLVGSHPGPAVVALGRRPDIAVTGAVPSVEPYYARAVVAASPVRAGGGTRIKAIEAFAHGVPLVATSIGVEGLDVEPGRHALVADTVEDFAAACLRIARDRDLATRLRDHARALYRERFALAPVAARIRALALTGPGR